MWINPRFLLKYDNFMKKNKIYIFIIAFTFLLLTSKQSFLYPMNDWCDSNAFFTIGKSWMNGIMPYKDLFEQKGPILFFLYGIGYLISNKSFFGCFIIEVIFFSLSLYYSFKIINMFFTNKKSYYILILYSFLIVTSQAFYGGGSAEEYSLFFITYNMYLFIKYLKEEKINLKQFFLNGIFCSIVFFIKFNLTSFWIGFFIILIIESIIYKKESIKKVLAFSLGFVVPVIIIFAYFYINSSLYELIDAYFIKNIFMYPSASFNLSSINDGITNLFVINLKYDFILIFLLIFYLIYIIVFIKNKREKLFLLLLFVFPFLFICCFGTWFEYYFFPFSIFILLSLIWMIKIIKTEKLFNINKYIYIIIICILTLLVGKNTFMLKYKKYDFVQYKFGEIINQYEDKTILNYGFIDTGFYLSTNTMPNIRFFHTMNFSHFKEMFNEQMNYIKTRKTNFVITGSPTKEKIYEQKDFAELSNNYDLIAIERHNKDYGFYYGLYKAK